MLTVADLMTDIVFSLQRIDTLDDARTIMEWARVRHIPVVNEGGLFIGLVTHRDLLAYTVSRLAEIEKPVRKEIETGIMVADIMQTKVFTATPDMPLHAAAAILYDKKCGCLPVVVADRLVGIITESDFLRLTIALLREQ
jgi:CBS domain-containing membrane protein